MEQRRQRNRQQRAQESTERRQRLDAQRLQDSRRQMETPEQAEHRTAHRGSKKRQWLLARDNKANTATS